MQVAELHDFHIKLIDTVCENHKKVIILLGVPRITQTEKNPLDFATRKQMIQERYPNITILSQRDERKDEVWSAKLLQAGIDRDTQNFATKAAFAVVDGVEVDVIKSPTEMDAEGNIIPSFKKSKSGRLKLVKGYRENTFEVGYLTVTSKDSNYDSVTDVLVEVFNNGELLVDWTFEQVRERAVINEQVELV